MGVIWGGGQIWANAPPVFFYLSIVVLAKKLKRGGEIP